MSKHELDLGAATLNDVANAAIQWWALKRPRGWSVEEHLGNPRINCLSAAEKELAQRVAELCAMDRGIKR